MLERAPGKISANIRYLAVIVLVMGASIHLAADSVDHRLMLIGYKNHMTVRENLLSWNITPAALVRLRALPACYRGDGSARACVHVAA